MGRAIHTAALAFLMLVAIVGQQAYGQGMTVQGAMDTGKRMSHVTIDADAPFVGPLFVAANVSMDWSATESGNHVGFIGIGPRLRFERGFGIVFGHLLWSRGSGMDNAHQSRYGIGVDVPVGDTMMFRLLADYDDWDTQLAVHGMNPVGLRFGFGLGCRWGS